MFLIVSRCADRCTARIPRQYGEPSAVYCTGRYGISCFHLKRRVEATHERVSARDEHLSLDQGSSDSPLLLLQILLALNLRSNPRVL